MQGGVRRDGQRGMKITWGPNKDEERGEMGVRDVRAASRATEAERDAGVNDVRIVQRARVRLRSPPPSLHMLAPAAQPTLDKKKKKKHPSHSAPAAVEQPASPRQPALELGGPSLASQTFEILATASAWRHCVSL